MDPITPIRSLIDETEKLLGHSPQPAIVALPIGALFVSNIADSLAILRGDDRYDDLACVSMAGIAGAVVTGLRDYSYIDAKKPMKCTIFSGLREDGAFHAPYQTQEIAPLTSSSRSRHSPPGPPSG